jgi:hypothetical protein
MYVNDIANMLPRDTGPTLDVGKRYVRVYMQRGKVQTDKDLDEKTEISKRLFSLIHKNIDSFEHHAAECNHDKSAMDKLLLETWGKIADSLSAYQERIGNESYLIDTKKGTIRFGDGFNGKKPQDSSIKIQWRSGLGKSDNVD